MLPPSPSTRLTCLVEKSVAETLMANVRVIPPPAATGAAAAATAAAVAQLRVARIGTL